MVSGEPTASGEDTIRELMWAERPAGTHLGPSSDSHGLSPLARDDESNAIATHVRLYAADDDDADDEGGDGGLDLRSVTIGGLAVGGAVLIVKELAPPAQRLWSERAMPALRSTWGALTGTRGGDEKASEEPTALVVAPAELVEDDRTAMSTAEARERLAAALLTRAFSDEQLRMLRGARLVDAPEPAELERALQSLTPEQREQGSRLLLESGSLEELRHLLGFSGPEGEPLPLRLTDGRS